MNNMRNKILMTLALLLTAVTGAWAQTETLLTTITATAKEQASYSTANVATVSFSYTAGGSSAYLANWGWWGYGWIATVTAAEGYTITKCIFYDDANRTATDSEAPFVVETTEEDKTPRINGTPIDGGNMWSKGINKIEVYGYKSEPAIDVKWDPATKTGNFKMPAYDVEIAPIYAPVAQWAKVENVDQLPTAIEGIFAESTDAIVKAGTVAKIGETENPQGTVMYAVTSTNQATAPALDAFSADVPTAKNITIAGDVLVWYYIKGADTPTGEKATAENTFNDSEICPEPIKVTVLSNKFDIQFNAANANTIETGKATVKVGDEAAEVDAKGKLTGVKMNSKVTVTAKEGYKFRKVEVKKKSASKLASEVTTEDIFKVIASDGMIYDNIAAAESAGTTAQGLVVYVGSNTGHATYTHGMALALKDEADNTWSGAKDACNAKNTSTPIVGALWIQATKDQWNTMFNAVGGDSKLRDCFSSAGGTNLIKFGNYWTSSSHEDYGEQGDFYMFSDVDWPGDWGSTSVYYNDNYHVRACIVF